MCLRSRKHNPGERLPALIPEKHAEKADSGAPSLRWRPNQPGKGDAKARRSSVRTWDVSRHLFSANTTCKLRTHRHAPCAVSWLTESFSTPCAASVPCLPCCPRPDCACARGNGEEGRPHRNESVGMARADRRAVRIRPTGTNAQVASRVPVNTVRTKHTEHTKG